MIVCTALIFLFAGCAPVKWYHPPENFTPSMPESAKVAVAFHHILYSDDRAPFVPIDIQKKIEAKILLALEAKGYEPIPIGNTDVSWLSNQDKRDKLIQLARDKGAASLLVITYRAEASDRVYGPNDTFVEAKNMNFQFFGLRWIGFENNFIYWKALTKINTSTTKFDFGKETKSKKDFLTNAKSILIGETSTVHGFTIPEEDWLTSIYLSVLDEIPQYKKS